MIRNRDVHRVEEFCKKFTVNEKWLKEIVGKTDLKFDMRDAGKLFVYLSSGENIRQKMKDMGWIPASLMPK